MDQTSREPFTLELGGGGSDALKDVNFCGDSMAAQTAVMVGGAIKYKRQYKLWLLVVLILFCWPAAIIYYFTRPKVPVQELQTYAAPAQPVYAAAPQPQQQAAPAYGAAPPAAAPAATGGTPNCPRCGGPTTFVQQYGRNYCYHCSQYA